MSKLYDLAAEYRQLAATLEEYDLEPATLLDTLDSSTQMMAIEEKAANIIGMTKNWEGDLLAIEKEIERLTARKKSIENRVKSVRQYLQNQLESAKINKIKCGTFSLSIKPNKESVNVIDQSQIPTDYIKTKIEQSVDKTSIYKAIKDGIKIPGVELVQTRSLNIR